MTTLQELTALNVGFVSLSEALDLTTPSGRALAGMLAVFAEFEQDILRDRARAGIDQARKDGKPYVRPRTAGKLVPEIKRLRLEGRSYREIAQRLGVSRPSVSGKLRWRSDRPYVRPAEWLRRRIVFTSENLFASIRPCLEHENCWML